MNAKKQAVLCTYCGASVMYERWVARRAEYRQAREQQLRGEPLVGERRFMLGGLPHRILGTIGTGETSDVLLGERADGNRALFCHKWLRNPDDRDLLEHEWSVLNRLHGQKDPASPHFLRRLPAPALRGSVHFDGKASFVTAYRYQSGFSCTLNDIIHVHKECLDPAHAVWLWRRLLELFGWLHQHGITHRAVLPQHVLVHVRDHGVLLLGWCVAEDRTTPRLTAAVHNQAPLYPVEVLDGAPFGPEHDLMMAARTMGHLLSGGQSHLPPPSTPSPLAEFMGDVAEGSPTTRAMDARAMEEELMNRARAVFGPPQYRKLVMPGWP